MATLTAIAQHSVILNSLPEEVVLVEEFIDKLNEKYNFREDMYGNVLVSVTEAVNNAIIHGNQRNPQKKVVVTFLLVNPFLVSILVEDEGAGFDYESILGHNPTSPEYLLSHNGRGLFVIESLCDKVIFHNGGSAIEMQFNV